MLPIDQASRCVPRFAPTAWRAPQVSVGIEFVVGSKAEKRTLTLRDAQHEYVLVEK